MADAFGVSISGFRAASTRLNVAAENIANVQSTSRVENTGTVNAPYVPQDVVQISQQTGGVQATVRDSANPVEYRFEPDHALADDRGLVAYPNIDLAEQLVQTKIATYDAQANLKVIKAESEKFKSLLDIFG